MSHVFDESMWKLIKRYKVLGYKDVGECPGLSYTSNMHTDTLYYWYTLSCVLLYTVLIID